MVYLAVGFSWLAGMLKISLGVEFNLIINSGLRLPGKRFEIDYFYANHC